MESGLKRTLEQRVYAGEQLTRDDGIVLFGTDELAWLGRLAHHRRTESYNDRVTFAIDRPIDSREIVYGAAGDPAAHLVDSVLNLRELSGGGTAVLVKEDGAPADALRTVAVARLLLGPAAHLTVDYASHGPALTQLLLNYGADDLSGIPAAAGEAMTAAAVAETAVDAANGTRWRNADKNALELDAGRELLEMIWDAGLRPVERDAAFAVLREHDAPVPLADRRAEPQRIWA
jgi:aminodeoxyfutalosine synthase